MTPKRAREFIREIRIGGVAAIETIKFDDGTEERIEDLSDDDIVDAALIVADLEAEHQRRRGICQ